MAQYRAFKVDEAGNIVGPADCFECTHDETALEKVRTELDGYAIELWVENRRVGLAVPERKVASAG